MKHWVTCLRIVMHRLPKVQNSTPYECAYRQLFAVHYDSMPALQTQIHQAPLHRPACSGKVKLKLLSLTDFEKAPWQAIPCTADNLTCT